MSEHKKTRSPPSRQIRSDWARYCDEFDDPPAIGPTISSATFSAACAEFGFDSLVTATAGLEVPAPSLWKYWPWYAVAIWLTVGRSREYERRSEVGAAEELSPDALKRLLDGIGRSADRLQRQLTELHALAFMRREARDAIKGQHVAALNFLVAQALAGRPSAEIDPDPYAQLEVLGAAGNWRGGLKDLLQVIPLARAAVSADAATSRRAADIRPLPTLVQHLALVWTNMANRVASASEVHRKNGETDSDFVRFVKGAAHSAGLEEPTARQIGLALHHT